MRSKILIVFVVLVLIYLSGCGLTNQNTANVYNRKVSISGNPLSVLAESIENLRQSTNFEARKTFVVKINSKQTSMEVWDFITNSSNLFSISEARVENNEQKIVFKRIHLKNVQYETNSNFSGWKTVYKSQKSFYFTYDYYILNRNLVLGLLNDFYSVKTKKFSDLVKNLKKTGYKKIGNLNTIEYMYNYKFFDNKRIVSHSGKIYIAKINGKVYPVSIYDDKVVKFKSNGTVVENITQIEIMNIGNAKPIALTQ